MILALPPEEVAAFAGAMLPPRIPAHMACLYLALLLAVAPLATSGDCSRFGLPALVDASVSSTSPHTGQLTS